MKLNSWFSVSFGIIHIDGGDILGGSHNQVNFQLHDLLLISLYDSIDYSVINL